MILHLLLSFRREGAQPLPSQDDDKGMHMLLEAILWILSQYAYTIQGTLGPHFLL